MPTLYERLTTEDGNQKIGIHAFKALMRDFNRGNITVNEIITAFDLTVEQQTDASLIYQKSNAAINKSEYFERLFGYLVLAESGTLPSIYNETTFWVWVNSV